MRNLEDVMSAQNVVLEGTPECPLCRKKVAAFTILDVSKVEAVTGNVACSSCLTDALRLVEPVQAVDPTWTGDAGLALKRQRDVALDASAWTILSDSPLSKGCQTEWLAYRHIWIRMTVDAVMPEDFTTPEKPELTYEGK